MKSGDILAEIETDKATMEFEAVDEGTIAKILVAEGTDGVKVGAPIAIMAGEGEDAAAAARAQGRHGRASAAEGRAGTQGGRRLRRQPPPAGGRSRRPPAPQRPGWPPARRGATASRHPARAPARAGAEHRPLGRSQGSGPGGRIVRADIERRSARRRRPRLPRAAGRRSGAAAPRHAVLPGPIEQAIPHEAVKLRNMRKTIARRLTESKQQIPHIYLTVDIQLDALLKLRGELNAGLASRGVKLCVNDLLIKALAQALIEVPECNVSFAGDQLIKYSRADISVAVSIPGGLITPIIVGADTKASRRSRPR